MQVYTSLPYTDLRQVTDAAQTVEAAGYDGVSVPENKHDPFLPLAVAALATEKLQLATGVAISFPRSPMMAANVGWDLQRASNGRFELGLGS